MGKLYFRVASDWEEVVKLRNEIEKLKQTLLSMDKNRTPAAVAELEVKLGTSRQRMDELVVSAAKAGAVMENDFKSKIYQSSQSVNDFTQKIINQKNAIGTLQMSLRKNKELYKTITLNGNDDKTLLNRIREQEKLLGKERDTLFRLTQEQANARLSVKKLRDEYSLYQKEGQNVVDSNNNMALSFKKTLAAIGGIAAIKQLGSEIIKVRGEFQSMQTAIETLVGKDMAGNLIPQIKELAKVSPLTLSDMVGAEKMMLGFNIKAEDTIRYLQALGDISMGDSQKFNSLTLAFSQMSAAGKLMGQDLNQMINAGFNPLQTISEKTGKSIATLKEEMSKGAISTEMVQKAFIDATSEGGRFFGMSESASKTINGQLSMMQDALDEVYNEIGTKGEGVIMSGIQATTSLIQNYETVGKVLIGLVATYGVARTATMAYYAMTRTYGIYDVATKELQFTATMKNVAATKYLAVQQAILNKIMLANPYVLMAAVITGYIATVWALHDSTTASEAAQKSLTDTVNKLTKKEEERKSVMEGLINKANDEKVSTNERNEAMKSLILAYPSIIKKYIDEEGHLKNIIALKREIAEFDSVKSTNTLGKVVDKNQGHVDFLKQVKSKNIDIHSDENLLNRYKSLQAYALKSYNGRSALSIDELVDFYSKRGSGLRGKYNRSQTENKLSSFTERFGESSGDDLNDLLQSRQKLLKQFTDKIGYVYDSAIKDYVKKTDIESQITQIEGIQNGRKDIIHNKSHWEKLKKEAQLKLDALSDIEADGKDGVALKKKITEYDKKINSFSANTSKQEETAVEKLRKKQKKTSEELLSLRRQNQQDEINLMRDGAEKKLKQIDLDYRKEIDAIKKQEKEWSREQSGKLTREQSIEISTRYASAENIRDKNIADTTKEQLKAEQQALNGYLKEYGTFQQQKFAIAQEYAEKIKKVQEESGINSAQVKLLEKQRDAAIQNKETEAIKANIDWVTVFGEFGGMFNDMIKPALEEAKKYIQTDKFKNSDQASQKALIDAISQMEKSLGGSAGVNFKKLGQDVQIYQNALRELNAAKEEEIDAINKLKKAQVDYEKALKNGTEQEKQIAKDALDNAQANANAASENVKAQTAIANESQQNVTDTATKLKASMDNLVGGLQQMASGGGLYNAYSGIIKMVNGFKDAIGKTSESLREVPIVGWILSIIDVLKDGLSNLVGGLLDAVFNAVSGIISDVLSGDLFVTIGKSLRDGIGNILNAISFGGFNSLFGIGGNTKEVEESIDRLTDRNEHLQIAIESLTDEMKASKGTKSVEAYRNAYNFQKEQDTNYLKIAQEQARYSGSHHSWQYYMGWSAEDIKWVQDNVNKGFTGTSSLWGLTPEEMEKLRSNVDIWTKMQDAGKGGYGGRVTEKLDDYIDQAGKLEELTDALYEGLTGMSFDSMYDSFISNLMDMKYDAKAAAEDISEYFMRAMLSNKIGEMYSDKLEEWWKKFGASMKDNDLTESERNSLQEEYMKYVEEAMKLRDQLAAATGYDKISQESTSQSSTKGAFETMSQDTGNELNGRFTALQIAGEEIKNQNVLQTQSLNLLTMKTEDILRVNSEIKDIAGETRDLIANSYLELVQISENTGAIIKPIQQMQKDMAEVKKNTSKL